MPNFPPKIGQTRCYWTLLTSDLSFRYLDPVLTAHLGDQAPALLASNLLDFVHPDEKDHARADLRQIIDQKGLHGSVTRVRYLRLSKVREELGYKGPITSIIVNEFPDAKKIVYDDNYMAIEFVINWAADHTDLKQFGGGVILCFVHAVIDIDTVADNDERRKTGWSNWCGTPLFDQQQADIMRTSLTTANTSPRSTPSFAPGRCFHIISNDSERRILFAWPPSSNNSQFASIATNVRIEAATDAKTSCQRRFVVRQSVEGLSVESIFILHGTIIFTCHFVEAQSLKLGSSFAPHKRLLPDEAYYDVSHSPNSARRPRLKASLHDIKKESGPTTKSVQPPLLNSSQDWENHIPASGSTRYANEGDPLDRTVDSFRRKKSSSNSPTTTMQQQQNQQAFYTAPSESISITSSMNRRDPHVPTTTEIHSQPFPTSNGKSQLYSYPSTTSMSRSANDSSSSLHITHGHQNDQPDNKIVPSSYPIYSSSGRVGGNPPPGVNRCISCKTTVSPEWRKGPNGKKELCNACGLRYARSRAKKEGHQPQKRRKEGQQLSISTSKSSGSGTTGQFNNSGYGHSGGEYVFHQHENPSPRQHDFVPTVPSSVPITRDPVDQPKGYHHHINRQETIEHEERAYYLPHDDHHMTRRKSPDNHPIHDKYTTQYRPTYYEQQAETTSSMHHHGQPPPHRSHVGYQQGHALHGASVDHYGRSSGTPFYSRETDRSYQAQQLQPFHSSTHHGHGPHGAHTGQFTQLPRISTIDEEDSYPPSRLPGLPPLGSMERHTLPPLAPGGSVSEHSTPDPVVSVSSHHAYRPQTQTVGSSGSAEGMSTGTYNETPGPVSPDSTGYRYQGYSQDHNHFVPSSYERSMPTPMAARPL